MALHPDIVDRHDAVLVVIDEQERLADVMEARDQVVATTARLVRTAGVFGIPVVVTRQYPQGLGDSVPEILEALEEVASTGVPVSTADKTTFCCGEEPTFVEALAHLGRGQVILTGMETHICVTQTALALLGEGKRVQVVSDACCSRSASNHESALARLRAAGAVVTVSESVMYEAAGRAGTPEFKALLSIVKGS